MTRCKVCGKIQALRLDFCSDRCAEVWWETRTLHCTDEALCAPHASNAINALLHAQTTGLWN